MKELRLWLTRLVNHWPKSLSGVSVGGVGVILPYLLERSQGWTMSKLWYIPIFTLFYILGASFMAWKDEHKSVIDLTNQLEQKRKNKETRDKLATFLSRANVIQNQCAGVEPVLPEGRRTFQEYEDFHRELYACIYKEMGNSYAQRMVDSISIQVPQPHGLSDINTITWRLTAQTKVRIEELMNKLE
jgi:hypothetical protein